MRNYDRDENQMRHTDRKLRTAAHGLARLLAPASAVVVLLATSTAALAQSDAPNPLLPRNLSPWGMFVNADIVVQAVMIGLAFASLVTWTIFIAKMVELAVAQRKLKTALDKIADSRSLAEAQFALVQRADLAELAQEVGARLRRALAQVPAVESASTQNI